MHTKKKVDMLGQLTAHSSQLTAHSSQLTAHSSQLTLKLKRRFRNFKRQFLVYLLVFSLLLTQFASIFVPSVYAASSPWTQTDWSGGSGQTSWSDSTKYSTGSNLTDSTTGQLTLSVTSGWCNNASCDSSWKYRKKITFNNTDANLGVTSENLVNFPVLVKLSSSNIDYTKTQDSGQDIRFTDTDGSDLAYEIEKWDETGTSFVWVKVPQIDASSSTDNIYMYYGNSSATDAQAATSVWDSNYVVVQHLAETSGTNINDSTSNNNDGTKLSATEPNPTTSGQIDGAQTFDGTNDYVDGQTKSLGNTDITLSLWVKTTSTADQYVFGGWYAAPGPLVQFTANVGTDNKANMYSNTSGTRISSTTTVTDGNWHYIVYQDTGTTMKIFVDGTEEASGNAGSVTYNDWQWDIGCEGGTACSTPVATMFNGQIDEVRISNTARSAAWITASYKSETDTFNTFASEESVYSTTSGTLTSSIFDTEFSAGAAWGTLTYSATTPSNTSVSVKVRTSNSSSMTGATAFSSCTAVTSGADISSNSCVTDSHRYIQYELTLANTDSVSTPTFQDVSTTFATYDSTAPSISLTALATDPNSDTTPTLSGTATESIGTVSNVQFQMDATSGSWTACTADDGTFDEATDTFTCTPSALSDGSHTMYVRATDSNSNTTSSGSESSDAFTIDATNPASIDLDSPGDNSYTSSERPTYKWKATTDATAGLSKYVLEIDNPSIGSGQASGDFTIDDIPTSRTTDYEKNKYTIHYENFSDSDSTNNYISVYTKSHNDWGSSENDGKIREGKVSWKVKAVDNASNETSSSRTLFVDRTSPNVEFTQINSTPFTSNNFSTTDKTPIIYGKITDLLAGGDSSQTQSENGPRVASAPKEVNIKVEKKTGLTYTLVTLYKVNMDSPYYSCDSNQKTIDNNKQKCDKYLPFEYTPKEDLSLGEYRITISGKDKADNGSSETTLTLSITTLAKITTKEERKIIEEEIKTLKPEEKKEIKEELEITKPTEEVPKSVLEKTGEGFKAVSSGLTSTTSVIASTAKQYLIFVGNGIKIATSSIGNGLLAMTNAAGQGVASVGTQIGNGVSYTVNAAGSGLAYVGNGVGTGVSSVVNTTGSGLAYVGNGIGQGYNSLADNAPGVAKTVLTGARDGVVVTTQTVTGIAQGTANITGKAINSTREGIANLAFVVGQKTDDISHGVGTAIIKIGYLFVPEPTRISDVQVKVLSPTSAKISWKTNHPANGKVNYGLDETYPKDIQTDKRTTYHEFTLTNLTPNTEYHFEVMSQNKNYVYDANRKFTTPPTR